MAGTMTPAEPAVSAQTVPGRSELERRQVALVAALVVGADPPADMDGARIRVQAEALAGKRARAVALAQPELAAALGSGFGPAFTAYASTCLAPGSAAQDAAQFARYLSGTGQDHRREIRRAARRVAGRRWPARR